MLTLKTIKPIIRKHTITSVNMKNRNDGNKDERPDDKPNKKLFRVGFTIGIDAVIREDY